MSGLEQVEYHPADSAVGSENRSTGDHSRHEPAPTGWTLTRRVPRALPAREPAPTRNAVGAGRDGELADEEASRVRVPICEDREGRERPAARAEPFGFEDPDRWVRQCSPGMPLEELIGKPEGHVIGLGGLSSQTKLTSGL